VQGYSVELWWGVFAPAGTPKAIVDKLNAEIRAIIDTPEMRETFAREGAEPTLLTAPEFTGYVRNEIDKWRKVAKARNITAN
jgi:tripartite-type tricarboxylate transporter receptor subunit TctC